MGIRSVMLTGDNPLTAGVIAREAGVDDFIAEATPEDKIAVIQAEQRLGKLVAMTTGRGGGMVSIAHRDGLAAFHTRSWVLEPATDRIGFVLRG
jgi:K+-transporting ATPase ATPase B chain